MLHTVRPFNIAFVDAEDIVAQVFVNVEDAWEEIETGGPWTFGSAAFTLVRLDTFLDFLSTIATDTHEKEVLAEYDKSLERLPTFVNLEY
jgi:hypothetical protein